MSSNYNQLPDKPSISAAARPMKEDLQGYSSGRRGHSSTQSQDRDEYSRRPEYHDRARERVISAEGSAGRERSPAEAPESSSRDPRATSARDGYGRDRYGPRGKYDDYGSYGRQERPAQDSHRQERPAPESYRQERSTQDSYRPRGSRFEETRSYDRTNYDRGYDRGYERGGNRQDDFRRAGREREGPRTGRDASGRGGYNGPTGRGGYNGYGSREPRYDSWSARPNANEGRQAPAQRKKPELSPEELIGSYQRSLAELEDVEPLESLKIIDSRWGVKPKGFENVTAQRAKLSGLFPLPGYPRPVDFTKLEGSASEGILSSNDILNDASKIDPIDARGSKTLVIKDLDFEKINYLTIVEFFNDYLKRIDIEQTSLQNINSKRKTKDDKNLIIQFTNNTCATIIASLDSLKLPYNLHKEESQPSRDAGEKIELTIRRPNEYVVQTVRKKQSEYEFDKVVDSPKKVTLMVAPEKSESEILEQLKTIKPVKAFQILREIGTKESLGVAFLEFETPEGISLQKQINLTEELIEKVKSCSYISNAFFSCLVPNQTSIQDCAIDMENLKSLVRNENVSAHSKSRVIQLINLVTARDLVEDSNYHFIQQDIHQEVSKFGKIVSMKIPRPANDYTPGLAQFTQPGLGKVYIELEDEEASMKVIMELAGRYYNDRVVLCSFYDQGDYLNGIF